MKYRSKPDILPFFTLGAGLVGAALRFWLYATGVDEKGLLVTGHPADILVFVLTAIAVMLIFLQVRALGYAPGYAQLFPRSVPAAIGNAAAAAGILYAGLRGAFLSPSSITAASCLLGLLAVGSLVYLGWCRMKQVHPSFVFHGLVTVYFMVHVVSQYRLWSSEPQLQNYFSQLFACVFLMLSFYHRAALDARSGSRTWYVFCNQAALFFCCLSIRSDVWPFYLAMAVWAATNLCSRKSLKKRIHHKKTNNMFLPEAVRFCIRRLEAAGFSTYAVGGCVRDDLLDLTPHDYDLCTSATPEQIAAVFSEYPQVHSGEKHGTIGIILESGMYEITTFRAEGGYTDSRHPDWVQFVPTVQEDLSRRDFTVNAIAYSPNKGFIDPYGGRQDLADHILRAVGDPVTRFTEDPLRILRGVRFAVRYHLTPEAETEKAMVELAPRMKRLARERVFDELCKLLPLVHAEDLLHFAPILIHAIPELAHIVGFEQRNPHHKYDVYTHTAYVVEAVPKALPLRWAALLHDIGKPTTFTTDENGQGHFYGHAKASAEIANDILLRLRASTSLREQVVFLIEHHMTLLVPDKKLLRRRLGQHGEEAVYWLLALQEADFGSKGTNHPDASFSQVKAMLQEIMAEKPCLTVKDLAITGKDILALDIEPGPRIGTCMRFLLNQVQDEVLPNTKEALLQTAADYLNKH